MITFHASAVLHVRDGYTGRSLSPSSLLCTLDGAAVRPLSKPEGYLLLLDLSPGPHHLVIRGHGFQEEWVDFQAGEATQELEVDMKPGADYPFRGTVTRLTLTVTEKKKPAFDRTLWLATGVHRELKIAQTRADAGALQFRLYCKGPSTAVSPGLYLLSDGGDSEIVLLRRLEEEMGTLAAPLRRNHSRGRPLLPAQRYHTGPDGRLTATFQTACTVELYAEERGLLASLPLEPGENHHTLSL